MFKKVPTKKNIKGRGERGEGIREERKAVSGTQD